MAIDGYEKDWGVGSIEIRSYANLRCHANQDIRPFLTERPVSWYKSNLFVDDDSPLLPLLKRNGAVGPMVVVFDLSADGTEFTAAWRYR